MPSYLYTVTDVFALSGGFLVAAPGVPWNLVRALHVRVGNALELRRPDGGILKSHIFCPMLPYPNYPENPYIFSLPRDLTKADVPVGTEVWLDEDKEVPNGDY